MRYYRVYFLNGDNKITEAAEADCETDEQAIAVAREKAAGRRVEIWQADRRVGVYGPS